MDCDTVDSENRPCKCHRIQGRVHRQREDSDVNIGTGSSVHHRGVEADAHRKRP